MKKLNKISYDDKDKYSDNIQSRTITDDNMNEIKSTINSIISQQQQNYNKLDDLIVQYKNAFIQDSENLGFLFKTYGYQNGKCQSRNPHIVFITKFCQGADGITYALGAYGHWYNRYRLKYYPINWGIRQNWDKEQQQLLPNDGSYISQNEMYDQLYIMQSFLNLLDISNNTQLLVCNACVNSLQEVILNNPNLYDLDLGDNYLTYLNVSSLINIQNLDLAYNMLDSYNLSSIIVSLNNNCIAENGNLNIVGNERMDHLVDFSGQLSEYEYEESKTESFLPSIEYFKIVDGEYVQVDILTEVYNSNKTYYIKKFNQLQYAVNSLIQKGWRIYFSEDDTICLPFRWNRITNHYPDINPLQIYTTFSCYIKNMSAYADEYRTIFLGLISSYYTTTFNSTSTEDNEDNEDDIIQYNNLILNDDQYQLDLSYSIFDEIDENQ